MSARHIIRARAAALPAELKACSLQWSIPLAAMLIIAAVWSAIAIADAARGAETRAIDQTILRALRSADDPAIPIGPKWLAATARDITALGDTVVLSVLIAFIATILLLERRRPEALLLVVAAVTGKAAGSAMKLLFSRNRPDLVPHLTDVSTASFPSGHASLSAVVLLTIALLLARISTQKRTRIFILTAALLLTGLVGCTRVYLGVHYPTDVLAGWLLGLGWALLCWAIFRLLQPARINTSPAASASPSSSDRFRT